MSTPTPGSWIGKTVKPEKTSKKVEKPAARNNKVPRKYIQKDHLEHRPFKNLSDMLSKENN